MLVGNTAEGFGLVHAEVFESEFVNSRPFRVNAGDVSEYILVPTGDTTEDLTSGKQMQTKYLAELQAGDPVYIVNTEGKTRIANVARVKIETRPMRMLKLLCSETDPSFSIIITAQYAETVRFICPDKSTVSITNLNLGDSILVAQGPKATHFGTPIDEKIVEK